MAIQLKDRIYTNCSTIGKADIEIGATKEGYQGWEAITDGSTVYYCITEDVNWEVGYGVKTGAVIVRNLLSSNTGSLLSLDGKASVFCTYPAEKAVFLNLDGNIHFPSSNVTANTFVGKGSGITNINAETNNLAPEAPTDGETYARNNKTWVSISDTAGIPDAPVDGLMYGRKDGEWGNVADAENIYTKTETNILLDNKADKSNTYTKSETYSSVEVDGELFKKADKATTYTKSEVDATQSLQDTEIAKKANQATTYTKDESNALNNAQNSNISANTTAIGTLSGQVANNSEDIATLQDGIFFSSSYTTDYPSSPNRDPETGNIYLQNLSAFTYSYADANQAFISKTDEQGNVRQFTAVKPDDIIVLNQVESPNYGRYKVSSVNDLGDYVNVIMDFQVGEGTVLEGDTLALQAFPASEGGGDSIWTEVDGIATYDGGIKANGSGTFAGVNLGADADSGSNLGYSPANDTTVYNANAGHTWYLDGSTKLVLDKTGDGNGQFRVADLASTTNSNPANVYANSAGKLFMSTATPSSGGIPEAPVDGKQYGRQDATWTEVTGGEATPSVTYTGAFTDSLDIPSTSEVDYTLVPFEGEGWLSGKYTVDTDGSFIVNAKFQWSLINPATNQLFRYCLVFVNNLLVYRDSHGVNANYPYGSLNQTTWVGNLKKGDVVDIRACQGNVDVSTQTVAINNYVSIAMLGGSGTGGGGGTPEAMVWEDKTADRVADATYTNNHDVPLYVQIDTAKGASGANFAFEIDGKRMGKIGTEDSQCSLFIVPAKATYKLIKMVADGTIENWNEAKMPMAIGGGGSYTPEAMVWENVKADRVLGTEYTNDNDVPLYVQAYTFPQANSQMVIKVDGASVGGAGGAPVLNTQLTTIVPVGSTYEIAVTAGTGSIIAWQEARMPVAIGTGGGKTATWSSFVGDAVPTILNDSNIASIDRISKGLYHINFKEPMSSDDYAVNCSVGIDSAAASNINIVGCAIDKTKCYVAMRTVGTASPAAFESAACRVSVVATDNPTLSVGGDSLWKDELGYAVHDGQVKAIYDNSEAQVNTAEPKQTLALTNPNGDDGTGDNNYTSLGFNVADGATSQGFITYARGGDHKGKFVFSQRTGSDTYATQMVLGGDGVVKVIRDGQEINLNPSYSDTGNAIIESNDPIGLMSGGNLGLKIIPDGRTYMYGVKDNEGAATPNVVIGPDGQMFKSTTATYSAEEVDKKLAIKDKLIEKLSERLDKLEKRVK